MACVCSSRPNQFAYRRIGDVGIGTPGAYKATTCIQELVIFTASGHVPRCFLVKFGDPMRFASALCSTPIARTSHVSCLFLPTARPPDLPLFPFCLASHNARCVHLCSVVRRWFPVTYHASISWLCQLNARMRSSIVDAYRPIFTSSPVHRHRRHLLFIVHQVPCLFPRSNKFQLIRGLALC